MKIILIQFLILSLILNIQAFQTSTSNFDLQQDPRIEEFDQKYFWGTYKPQLIHAVSSRNTITNNPLSIGLMYYTDVDSLQQQSDLQYQVMTRKGDKTIYAFRYHDGHSFAQHTVQDPYLQVNFQNSFIKISNTDSHQEWIDVMTPYESFQKDSKNKKNSKTEENDVFNVIYYVAIEQANKNFQDQRTLSFSEKTQGFLVTVNDENGNTEYISFYGNAVRQSFKSYTIFDSDRSLNYNMKSDVYQWIKNGSETSKNTQGTYIALQFEFNKEQEADYELVIHYDNQQPSFQSIDLQELEKERQNIFHQQYQDVFGVPSDDIMENLYDCGIASFSDLMGGITYCFGDLQCTEDLENCQAQLPMLSHTPSRYAFPRPFLWDEGFHLQVSCQWDKEFCITDLDNWFGTQSSEGWIPREQARGDELISYIPFLQENPEQGNPQTLIWIVNYLNQYAIDQNDEYMKQRIRRLLPKIELWFDWWQNTQKIEGYNLYKWWGNDKQNIGSGMDDFPRCDGEFYSYANIDCSSWMANFSLNISQLFKNVDITKSLYYQQQGNLIWEDIKKYLSDGYNFRDLLTNGQEKFELSPYNGAPDYMPFGLNLINKNDSDVVESQINDLLNQNTLWSDYGIRSLSKQSDKFGVGQNYWRGAIWVNANYMYLNSMQSQYKKYDLAQKTYDQLRENLTTNVCKNWVKEGYFFETFSKPPNMTGRGSHNHPFNGWTSVITLIITENYIDLLYNNSYS